MIFYTPQDALDWLKGKVGALFAARGILQDTYGRALAAQSKARTPETIAKSAQLVADLTVSLQDQTSLENKVRSVVPSSWIPQSLGLFPLVIGIGAIAIAGAVYLHLQKVAEHRDTLALIEKGVLTVAQAEALQSGGSLLGSGGFTGITENIRYILLFGASAYALYLFGPILANMIRRK
jgi:hypothetical protein